MAVAAAVGVFVGGVPSFLGAGVVSLAGVGVPVPNRGLTMDAGVEAAVLSKAPKGELLDEDDANDPKPPVSGIVAESAAKPPLVPPGLLLWDPKTEALEDDPNAGAAAEPKVDAPPPPPPPKDSPPVLPEPKTPPLLLGAAGDPRALLFPKEYSKLGDAVAPSTLG